MNKDGETTICWGRSTINLHDRNTGNPRMIRLRFALAYGQPNFPGRMRISPDLMVSNLAEFSLVYDSRTQSWSFSR